MFTEALFFKENARARTHMNTHTRVRVVGEGGSGTVSYVNLINALRSPCSCSAITERETGRNGQTGRKASDEREMGSWKERETDGWSETDGPRERERD